MTKNKLERINEIDEEIVKLKKRQRKLQQQHNAQERKERNHRLCRRHGHIEKFLPDLARLTDEQFDTFIEKVLLTPHTERILKGLAPPLPEPVNEPNDDSSSQDGETTAHEPAEASPPTSPPSKTNAAETVHNGGTGKQAKTEPPSAN
jgi:hypothetical protein